MLIYRISHHIATDTLSPDDINIVHLHLSDAPGRLPADENFMRSNFGFPLSVYEQRIFAAHYFAWEQFKQSPDDYCLVIEDSISLNDPVAENLRALETLFTAYPDWDIFFPYDHNITEQPELYEMGYRLGYRWGTEAYFIHRRGIDKLLGIPSIKQALDEELLALMMNDSLNLYYEKTDLIRYLENHLHKKSRKQEIWKALFSIAAWSSHDKELAGRLLTHLSHIAAIANVTLVLSEGSLLGHVRHGGIMPWDDDIDLALNEAQYGQLEAALSQQTDLAFGICYWGRAKIPYCKVWLPEGSEIPGYEHKFPFVDIWFYEETVEEIIFRHGVVYPRNIYMPFREIIFEGAGFMEPADSLSTLDITYPNWRNKIEVYSWSHRVENSCFFPIKAGILTDAFGRFVDLI